MAALDFDRTDATSDAGAEGEGVWQLCSRQGLEDEPHSAGPRCGDPPLAQRLFMPATSE